MEPVLKPTVLIPQTLGTFVQGIFGYFLLRNAEHLCKCSVLTKIADCL